MVARHEPDVLPDVLPRLRRHAAAGRRLPRRRLGSAAGTCSPRSAPFVIAASRPRLPRQRRGLAPPAACRPATTRGRARRSSGGPRRRRRAQLREPAADPLLRAAARPARGVPVTARAPLACSRGFLAITGAVLLVWRPGSPRCTACCSVPRPPSQCSRCWPGRPRRRVARGRRRERERADRDRRGPDDPARRGGRRSGWCWSAPVSCSAASPGVARELRRVSASDQLALQMALATVARADRWRGGSHGLRCRGRRGLAHLHAPATVLSHVGAAARVLRRAVSSARSPPSRCAPDCATSIPERCVPVPVRGHAADGPGRAWYLSTRATAISGVVMIAGSLPRSVRRRSPRPGAGCSRRSRVRRSATLACLARAWAARSASCSPPRDERRRARGRRPADPRADPLRPELLEPATASPRAASPAGAPRSSASEPRLPTSSSPPVACRSPSPKDEPLRTHARASTPGTSTRSSPTSARSAARRSRRSTPRAATSPPGSAPFTLDCAGCHQSLARGGTVTGGVAPSLIDATPTQIAEAIRIGPYLMPPFSPHAIDDRPR